MNTKLIRTYFKNVLLIAFAILFMAGSAGFSYKAHYCHNKLSGIAFYPGLGLQQSISCGCASDSQPFDSQNNIGFPVLKKNSCCSNVSFFSKLSVESPSPHYSSGFQLQTSSAGLVIIFSETEVSGNGNIQRIDSGLKPVHLSGRKLVLFLSQQRIPLISYNC